MINKKGALTLAEGSPQNAYKTDTTLLFNSQTAKRSFVLRTCFDSLGVWKVKHNVSVSPFKLKSSPGKYAAVIEKDLWIFGIDGTNANDIVAAVKEGMVFYDMDASEILSDIYVKNLNAEHENEMAIKALIQANKELYSKTCEAIKAAAKTLGVKGSVNFYVFSNNKNPKIPQSELHEALRSGGAAEVDTDNRVIKQSSQSNDATRVTPPNTITHLHLASIKL